jgi:hypothetical protein
MKQFVHCVNFRNYFSTGVQNKHGMKCFNYAQYLDPMLDIKRGVGDGGYGDPDYTNIEVVSGDILELTN